MGTFLLHHTQSTQYYSGGGCLHRWSKRVLEEFFQQGDMEKAQGLPLSPLMDRANTALAPSQINFIEFVVAPLFLQAS